MENTMDSILEIQVWDLEIYRGEAVGGMVLAHEKRDDIEFEKCLEDYKKMDELCKIGYDMMKGGLTEWNWKWVADNGHLCDMDWIWFKEDLEKAGVNKEEYDRKWKAKT